MSFGTFEKFMSTCCVRNLSFLGSVEDGLSERLIPQVEKYVAHSVYDVGGVVVLNFGFGTYGSFQGQLVLHNELTRDEPHLLARGSIQSLFLAPRVIT